MTGGAKPNAADIVARELRRLGPHNRSDFLKDLLQQTAAGLVVIEGTEKAAEAVYQQADRIVDDSKG